MLVNITPNLTQSFWNDLVAPFEKANPNITVKIQAPAAEGVKATLPQLLASGQVPDVVESLAPDKTLAPELLDLSKYSWAKNTPLAQQYKFDGKYLMANTGYQLQTIFFYNKKAFSDAGITTPPKTLAEFEDDLKKLKDAGWTPIQTGGEWMTQLTLQYIGIPTILAQHPDWYAKMTSGDLTFSQTYSDSVKLYESWVKDGYIPKSAVGVKYADAQQQFLDGKSAIYPMGSWFGAAEATAASKPDIGVFAGPAADGVDKPAIGGNASNAYVIMKATKNKDASAKLVEFLTTDKTAVTKQLQADENFRKGYEYKTDTLGAEIQKLVTDTPASSWTPTGDGYGARTVPAGYNAELNTQTQAILTGTSADTVIKSMDSWFTTNK